tara:strand:+ start:25438 stop:25752 length:315 start_codon:yes stop_codon:yes gene_type:complete
MGTKENSSEIYEKKEFVQGNKTVIMHEPVSGSDSIPEYYGIFTIKTEYGNVDRFFHFEGETSLDDCFGSFEDRVEEEVKEMARKIQEEKDKQLISTPNPDLRIL